MGFFDLFKKKEIFESLDLSTLKVDFHSHLLPNLDDGVENFEQSISILKDFQDLGYKKVIITPHVMSDFYKNSMEDIQNQFIQLEELVKANSINIELDYSAEYYLDEHFYELYEKGEIRTFGNKYFLFELSYFNEPSGVQEFIFRAKNDGYTPIMAHPERYPYWTGNIELFQELKGSGCELQLNINSLSGHYGEGALKMAELLIENQLADYLCSDCHIPTHIHSMEKVKLKKHLNEMLLNTSMIKNHKFL